MKKPFYSVYSVYSYGNYDDEVMGKMSNIYFTIGGLLMGYYFGSKLK